MSFPDLADPGPAAPAAPLDEVILAALAWSALTCPDQDHASLYTDAYMQVAAGSAAWCDLTTALQAGNN